MSLQLASDAGVRHAEDVEEVKVNTEAVRATGNQNDFRVYKPIGTARTWASRETIYFSAGDEAMYGVVNRYLLAINWIQQISWNNDTDAEQEWQYSYTSGLSITQGSEVTNGFNLGASYKGMSIGIDHSTRTFKNTETSSSATFTKTVKVPPRSKLFFYQKRYDFQDNITFINDAWGQLWNIGPWGGYSPLTTKVAKVQIMAEEYYTVDKLLPEGPGYVTVDSVAAAQTAGWTRKRENVTRRARNMLDEMGV
ncbi:hypothetical protein FHL15_007850 [Xylaria flabelliformis]|uniref:Uncharacterized protein n=1 Tax=Xylaria flabelliformis TaxID=2512241 RepID=A0A553HTH0_9PEZI|nr:hypothetical protein FHL15_007850 [Xylaria flabelliformis]